MAGLRNMGMREQLRAGRLPLRFSILAFGLTGAGFGAALLIRAHLGVPPWNVLEVALAERTGLSVGTLVVIVAGFVLLLWLPLRQPIGIGTIANTLWFGPAIDLSLMILPDARTLPMQLLMLAAGIACMGIFGAVYVGAQFGAGPRDGLMTGLHYRFGWPVGRARAIIEVTILLVGFLMGGPVGVGTVAFALLVGPIVHWALPRVTIDLGDAPIHLKHGKPDAVGEP